LTVQPAYTRLEFDPQADPSAIVPAGAARFTVLTSRLIRMEYAPEGSFEDRPSQVFWFRRRPVPPFQVERQGERLILTTEHLRLEYGGQKEPFMADSLSVSLLPDGPTWRYGDADAGNLLGTARTLDRVSGATQLEPGLLSRDGWVVVDDSRTLVFDESAWLVDRAADARARDLYFFGYGRRYGDALRDYAAVSGGAPLLPRWVLGNWWSRYWEYSDEELRALMTEFRAHDVPLAVCIVDMDWHLVNVGEGMSGWTGYTWNNDLFPDPTGFIAWLHEQGLRTALNLHPALGIRPYEADYAAMAQSLGLDPAAGATIPFDIATRRFADAYFEVLHHPQEARGVDFWWVDWQQGTQTALAGLDPLWWLNHLHFYDLGRDGKRSFIFSRWGGLGNHRYPIGFSGDTVVSWESLDFQPYFTATAANVGYGWWSHDIGGHMQGIEDRELYTRWVQFGVFSPIFRLHSTKNPFHERRPWGYDAEVLAITREVMQLRHALIPYLYTMSRLNESDSVPPVRPMYHDYPDHEEAYACPQQYLFGSDLIVAPYTSPAEAETRLARQVVWLPPGDWYHFFSGEYYPGDAWYACYGGLADVPVFARAGAIVPLGPMVGWGGLDNPAELHLHVFTGADGRFALYEDDGQTLDYRGGAFTLTRFEQQWVDDRLRLTISPPSGDAAVVPPERSYHLHLHGLAAPRAVSVLIDGVSRPLAFTVDAEREIVHLDPLPLDVSATARITLEGAPVARRDRTAENVERLVKSFRMDSLAKLWLVSRLGELATAPERLADFGVEVSPAQMRALLEMTQGAGAHYVADKAEPHLVVLWNNREAAGFRHHFAQLRPQKWFAHERYGSSWGATPRFRAMRPEGDRWRLAVDYFGLHIETFGRA
jgi:alpha-glucosidase (family GH31 glycosyl hydrolase)